MRPNKKSHEVIGQEFDNVVLIIDKFFYYNKDNELAYNGQSFYSAHKMLFQNITRTRKKLNLIIIDNSQILNRCLSILQD